MRMYETETRREKFILISAEGDARNEDAEDCLRELALLVDTSGGEAVGQLLQRREAAHPGHYLGKGKIEELSDLINETGADGIVADDELTPAQQRNMAKMLGVKILDRTMVILDIFAGRASSAEGKAQVELAQLQYQLSHLSGIGIQLSRQAGGGGIRGGGIGTRGPGEKKLETDRRHIRSRIDQLKREINEIKDGRAVLRKKREASAIPVVSLVGYTNAGKSTLMNALTSAGVFAEDKLFATLDTTTRRLALSGGTEILLTDTVGFIHKLPHHLIQAFNATLEELKFADVLLHVVDFANPAYPEQMSVAYQLLSKLGCTGKPIVTAFNKKDAVSEEDVKRSPTDANAAACVPISARTGENIPELLDAVEKILQSMRNKIFVLIPYGEGKWVRFAHEKCEIISEEHTEEGTKLSAYADAESAKILERFAIQGNDLIS